MVSLPAPRVLPYKMDSSVMIWEEESVNLPQEKGMLQNSSHGVLPFSLRAELLWFLATKQQSTYTCLWEAQWALSRQDCHIQSYHKCEPPKTDSFSPILPTQRGKNATVISRNLKPHTSQGLLQHSSCGPSTGRQTRLLQVTGPYSVT